MIFLLGYPPPPQTLQVGKAAVFALQVEMTAVFAVLQRIIDHLI